MMLDSDTCSRIKINQWLGDTFQEISASEIGPELGPTALNFTPASQKACLQDA